MNTRSKARPRLNYVYSALVASTAALAAGTVGAQQVNADGTTVDIPANTTIDTGTAGGTGGRAIQVQNGGAVRALGPITVITGGGQSATRPIPRRRSSCPRPARGAAPECSSQDMSRILPA